MTDASRGCPTREDLRKNAPTGERVIWLEAAVADRLTAMRGPGESYSDVILRLIELEAQSAT